MFFFTQHVIISAAGAPIQTLPSLAAWWEALVEDRLELLQVLDKTGTGCGRGNLTCVRQDKNRNRKALCGLKLSLVLLKRSIVIYV